MVNGVVILSPDNVCLVSEFLSARFANMPELLARRNLQSRHNMATFQP